jgi:hypothetical protein
VDVNPLPAFFCRDFNDSTPAFALAYNDGMNTPLDDEAPRRKGILDSIKGYATSALGATRSKVDDISAEVEYRTLRLVWMLVWGLVGITSLWFALMLGVLTVIFGFHIPPKYAFGVPCLTFFLLSLVSLLMFQRTKHSRRKRERGAAAGT